MAQDEREAKPMIEHASTGLRAGGTPSPAVPTAITTLNADADRRVLVANACVITMDPTIGDFATADVLIEGSETGSTIRANNLKVLAWIFESTNCLIRTKRPAGARATAIGDSFVERMRRGAEVAVAQ